MTEIVANMMVTHSSDPRPMLVVLVQDGKARCKFPGAEKYRTFPCSELTPYNHPGPLRPIFKL